MGWTKQGDATDGDAEEPYSYSPSRDKSADAGSEGRWSWPWRPADQIPVRKDQKMAKDRTVARESRESPRKAGGWMGRTKQGDATDGDAEEPYSYSPGDAIGDVTDSDTTDGNAADGRATEVDATYGDDEEQSGKTMPDL